jgi:hypothetical protein
MNRYEGCRLFFRPAGLPRSEQGLLEKRVLAQNATRKGRASPKGMDSMGVGQDRPEIGEKDEVKDGLYSSEAI